MGIKTKNSTLHKIVVVALPLAVCLVPSVANADVRYSYTGQLVGTNALPLFSPTDRITGYVVLSRPALSGSFTTADFSDFAFQIGTLGLSKQQGASVSASFTFDANHNVTQWSFVIGQYSTPSTDPALVEIWTNSANYPPGEDRVTVYDQGTDELGAVAAPGSWQMEASPVPEPTSKWTMSLGLLAAFMLSRSRANTLA